MDITHLEKSRTFPVSVEHAYDTVLPTPLTDIFCRRYGAIAPIVAVVGQQGEWGTAVGQTRTIRLKDRTTMLETLIEIDRPHAFSYSISEVTGLMKPLVAGAIGTWSFAPAGTGARVTWAWDITPTKAGRAAMPVFARLWAGTARQAMEELEPILVNPA